MKAGKLSVLVCAVILGAFAIYASATQNNISSSTTSVQPDPGWKRVTVPHGTLPAATRPRSEPWSVRYLPKRALTNKS